MLATTVQTLPSGKRLRLARLGSGSPVVLLHGYPDNLQLWSELAPRLAERHSVIAFDWPGLGYSDAWPGGATPFHMAERLRQLLDWWGVERASLVGLDMGGQPALVFAARYPERTRQLVVMNSLVLWDERTSWEIRVLRQFGWNRLLLRHLPWAVFLRAERTFLPRGVRLPPALRADLWRSFRRAQVRAYIVRMCAGYEGTLRHLPALYGQIASPLLVLWAGRDKHFPPAHAARLHAAVRGAQLEIIPRAEHWMAWYLADAVGARIREFLDG
jgi:pimeloyl-ACP methyl ester carboxylesterase